jgi:hypothetical protein
VSTQINSPHVNYVILAYLNYSYVNSFVANINTVPIWACCSGNALSSLDFIYIHSKDSKQIRLWPLRYIELVKSTYLHLNISLYVQSVLHFWNINSILNFVPLFQIIDYKNDNHFINAYVRLQPEMTSYDGQPTELVKATPRKLATGISEKSRQFQAGNWFPDNRRTPRKYMFD